MYTWQSVVLSSSPAVHVSLRSQQMTPLCTCFPEKTPRLPKHQLPQHSFLLSLTWGVFTFPSLQGASADLLVDVLAPGPGSFPLLSFSSVFSFFAGTFCSAFNPVEIILIWIRRSLKFATSSSHLSPHFLSLFNFLKEKSCHLYFSIISLLFNPLKSCSAFLNTGPRSSSPPHWTD